MPCRQRSARVHESQRASIKVCSRPRASRRVRVTVAVMPPEKDPEDVLVGKNVAALRRRAGYKTPKDLAEVAGLHRVQGATLGKIERGERHLFPHEATRLAEVLKVDASEFSAEPLEETQLDRLERSLGQ